MKKMKKLAVLVKEILEKDVCARNSDLLLYWEVLCEVNPAAINATVGQFLGRFEDFNVPTIESVGRARRKVQELHPELRAQSKVEAARMLEEEKYIAFSRGVKIGG